MPKRRFDLDIIARFCLNNFASPWGSAVIAAFLYRRARNNAALGCSFIDYLAINGKLRYFLIFVLLRHVNRALSRLVVNHGWAADKPRWASGKEIVVISGGSAGIGAEIVKRLMKRTNKIAILDVSPPSFRSGPVRFYKCDITNEQNVHEVGERIRQELGDPTIVIANAGIIKGKKLVDTTGDQFLQVLKVNTLGAFLLIKEFLPAIAARNHGHFVTVGSSAAYMAVPQNGEYTASKSAALGLHETLAQELYFRYNAPKVRTTFVAPTKVRTPLGETLRDIDLQFVAPTIYPEEVAEAIGQQIDSGLSGHIMQPLYAAAFLPSIRSLPEWYRWAFNVAGRTHLTVTDLSAREAISKHGYKVIE